MAGSKKQIRIVQKINFKCSYISDLKIFEYKRALFLLMLPGKCYNIDFFVTVIGHEH